MRYLSFPHGPIVESPLGRAEDASLIPGPGGSHMIQSDKACVSQLLSLRSGAHALQGEKPLQWEAQAPQQRLASSHHN